jgi:GNAT superfamily N-acetyltransferase
MEDIVEIVEADLNLQTHQKDVLFLTSAYALDPMGNGAPLPTATLDRLIPGLKAHPTTIIFLAYVKNKAVGIATCFLGFSTFAALPIINISDFSVLPENRGNGIGRKILTEIDRKAQSLGCCRVTLEVQENNLLARKLYKEAGFCQAVYGPDTGGSLYYWKNLKTE